MQPKPYIIPRSYISPRPSFVNDDPQKTWKLHMPYVFRRYHVIAFLQRNLYVYSPLNCLVLHVRRTRQSYDTDSRNLVSVNPAYNIRSRQKDPEP